jgi:hypothetical protein
MSDEKKPVQVSKAPPPITPIRGVTVSRAPVREIVKPDWGHWRILKRARVWQACLLSLNIDPDFGDVNCSDIDGIRYWDRFKSFELGRETDSTYIQRLKQLSTNLNDRDFFTKCEWVNEIRMCSVELAELAAWAVSVEWKSLPPELVELARKPAAAQHEAPENPVPTPPWENPERLEFLARSIGKQWMDKTEPKPGVDAIAKHVEGELKRLNKTGRRGDYWDWQTIKKEALPGITGRKANGKK